MALMPSSDEHTDLFFLRVYLEYVMNAHKLKTVEATKVYFESHDDTDVYELLLEATKCPTPTSKTEFMSQFNLVFLKFLELLLALDPMMTVRKALDAVKAMDR